MRKEETNNFKQNLRRICQEQEVDIDCMAEDLEISTKTIYGWMEGNHPRTYDKLIRLADYLEVTVDELIR